MLIRFYQVDKGSITGKLDVRGRGTQLPLNTFLAPPTVCSQHSCQGNTFKMLSWILLEPLWWLPLDSEMKPRESGQSEAPPGLGACAVVSSPARPFSRQPSPVSFLGSPWATAWPLPLREAIYTVFTHDRLTFLFKLCHLNEAYLDHLA